MGKGRVSAEIADDPIAEVLGAIETIQRHMPFLIALTENERKRMVKVGPKSVGFLARMVEAVENSPELVPSFIDGEEFLRDAKLVTRLDLFLPKLSVLTAAIEDTRMVAGSEAMTTALVLYGIFKAAKRSVPSLGPVTAELGARFRRKRRATKPEKSE